MAPTQRVPSVTVAVAAPKGYRFIRPLQRCCQLCTLADAASGALASSVYMRIAGVVAAWQYTPLAAGVLPVYVAAHYGHVFAGSLC
jgi:hypothetical protein